MGYWRKSDFQNDFLYFVYWVVIMGKIDCIVEMREEQYNSGFVSGFNSGYDDGFEEASLMVARNLLINGFSVDVVLKNISLDEDKIRELLKEIENSD